MRRAAGRRVERGRNRRLEIVQTTGWVVPRQMLRVNGAIHLLVHLEILMDCVAGEGVVGHRRASQLEWSRWERVDVRNPGIRTERRGQAGASGCEEELILRRQARIA